MSTETMKRESKRKYDQVLAPPVGHDSEVRFMKLKKELLPGICNKVTLDRITTKLHWTSFPTLSTVSLDWRRAIQGRLVLDARIRTHSVESMVVVVHSFGDKRFISLFSWRDKVFYDLPPIAQLPNGLPPGCGCVSLAGKIYVLGGMNSPHFSKDVYMLDLTTKSDWVQCAPMLEGRKDFGCEVLQGKIYVIGGVGARKYSSSSYVGSEVYDPTTNFWSSMRPMGCLSSRAHVTRFGDELLVYGGIPVGRRARSYIPITCKWNILPEELQRGSFDRRYFMAEGKLHCLSFFRVDVYDMEKRSWSKLHHCSSAENLFRRTGMRFYPILSSVAWVDNELLVELQGFYGPIIIQSSGFGGKEEIVWKILPLDPPYGHRLHRIMCNIIIEL